ncbi:hypothetical protein Barb7_01483 [Bacteroidales bacterium Barb7]|nr:hypothetical protein Barb7_01483 [Bacteroidales bacterium Barb7]
MEHITPKRTPVEDAELFLRPSLGNISAPNAAPIVWNCALSVDMLAERMQSMKSAPNHCGNA